MQMHGKPNSKYSKKISKHVLILGASSDIGIDVIKLFIKSDWKVSAHYSSNNYNLKKIRSKKLKIIQFNFLNRSQNTEKKLLKTFNDNYDSIINLIGFVDNKSFQNFDLQSCLNALSINSLIPLIIIRNSSTYMLKNRWGRILNSSSIGTKFGGGIKSFNYSLSKHLLEFIPGIYKKWSKKNVLINTLRIGVTNTKIHNKNGKKNLKDRIKKIPIGRMAKTQEIADFIFYLSSEKNTFITSEIISISGGE